MHSRTRRRTVVPLLTVAGLAAGALVAGASPSVGATRGSGFTQVNLVADRAGRAQLTDPDLVNPWGIALGSTTPVWVANNGTATATIYAGANGTDPVSKVPLTVQVPAGVTGQVFNPTSGFTVSAGGKTGPSPFIFNTLGGKVAGWSPQVPPVTSARTAAVVRNHVYVGLAIARTSRGRQLFAADGAGGIDIFDSHFRLLPRSRKFRDPALPTGLTPYNVAVLRSRVYVAYAPPPGVSASVDGAIDVFTVDGRLIRRLVTGGPLDDPWGMVLAPAHWGGFGGALLVGNEENGRINAFDPATGRFRGTVRDRTGRPLENHGLWGLAFGNGTFGTAHTLIFAAGVGEYQHGLLGLIEPN